MPEGFGAGLGLGPGAGPGGWGGAGEGARPVTPELTSLPHLLAPATVEKRKHFAGPSSLRPPQCVKLAHLSVARASSQHASRVTFMCSAKSAPWFA